MKPLITVNHKIHINAFVFQALFSAMFVAFAFFWMILLMKPLMKGYQALQKNI